MLVDTIVFALGFVVVTGIPLAIIWSLWIKAAKQNIYDNWSFGFPLAFIAFIFSLITLAITLAPFNSKYWVLTAETATISSIESKVVTSGGEDTNLTSQFVLTLKDDEEAVVLTDPRIQTYEVGDTINLNCSYEWVYGGLDIKNCKILG